MGAETPPSSSPCSPRSKIRDPAILSKLVSVDRLNSAHSSLPLPGSAVFPGRSPGQRAFHSLTPGYIRLFQKRDRLRPFPDFTDFPDSPDYFRQQTLVFFGSKELPGIGSNAVKVTGCVHRPPIVAE